MYQVRNGQKVVITCPECGCRLRFDGFYWLHYQSESMGQLRDAKGHKCSHATMGWLQGEGLARIWSTGPHWNPMPQNS